MANLIEQAIACDDGDRAARMVQNASHLPKSLRLIQEALGIESGDVANYVFPKSWPAARPYYRRVAADRSAVFGLVMHFTPFFQFALLLVIPGALLILLTA